MTIGNTIEAGADLGGMAAALNLFVPVPIRWLTVGIAVVIIVLQLYGSYVLIPNYSAAGVALLAYAGAACMAKPDLGEVPHGTFLPVTQFDRNFQTVTVAVIGTTSSATSTAGSRTRRAKKRSPPARRGRPSARAQLTSNWRAPGATSDWDGLLECGHVLHDSFDGGDAAQIRCGTDIQTAAEAAEALVPRSGRGGGAAVSVRDDRGRFLAAPAMTTGAAYDLAKSVLVAGQLGARLGDARRFYATIVLFTLIGVAMDFVGLHPIQALVWAGGIQVSRCRHCCC